MDSLARATHHSGHGSLLPTFSLLLYTFTYACPRRCCNVLIVYTFFCNTDSMTLVVHRLCFGSVAIMAQSRLTHHVPICHFHRRVQLTVADEASKSACARCRVLVCRGKRSTPYTMYVYTVWDWPIMSHDHDQPPSPFDVCEECAIALGYIDTIISRSWQA